MIASKTSGSPPRASRMPSVDELLVAETFYGGGDERSLPCSPCPESLLDQMYAAP